MEFILENWNVSIEVLILWAAIYSFYRSFRHTRGANILLGILVTFLVLAVLSQFLDLRVIGWILTRAVALLAFAIIVIFQPELRNAFAKIGSGSWFGFNNSQQNEFLDLIEETLKSLSKKRHGALLVVERSVSLKDVLDSGVVLNAEFSQELVESIFHPKTSLHDGGMILSKGKIAGAGCLFPVSQKELADRSIGLRHRAAIGLTEETDSVALIVSEETGGMSIAINGELERNLKPEEFKSRLEEIFLKQNEKDTELDNEELDR